MDQRIDEPVVILRQILELTEPTDMLRRVELCRRALALAGRDQDPMLWAELQVQLGTSLAESPGRSGREP